MPAYYMHDAAFHLPDAGYVDRTVHVLESKLPGGSLRLELFRSKIPAGRTLREIASAHLAHEAQRLEGFHVLGRTDVSIGGAPAIDVAARFRRDGGVVYQREAHVAAHGAWLVFVMTAPLAEREACDAHMAGVLATARLRDER
jgi:hypothetical protein